MTEEIVFPSRIRRELALQHQRLRDGLRVVEEVAAAVRAGAPVGERFRLAVDGLLHDLESHNLDEERHLEPLLLHVDAWGPARVTGMLHEHRAEHAAFRAVLALADGEDLGRVARAIPALVARLERHMAEEERTFLAPDVVRDDVISVGPTS